MLNAFPKTRHYGFSLVELMVAVVILGILLSIALPNFRTWLQNSEIRNAAESITNGLQRARAEAVSRNTNVAFTLGVGTSWSVYVVVPASGVDSRSSLEGSPNVTLAVTPAGKTTVTFNNFGGVQPSNADGSAPFTAVDLSAAGGTQDLRVTIGVGGNARLCDPNAPVSSTRAC